MKPLFLIIVILLFFIRIIFQVLKAGKKGSSTAEVRYNDQAIAPKIVSGKKILPPVVTTPPPANQINFDRLITFIHTPRTYYGAFRAIVGEFQGESEKWKWTEEMAKMPLIYYTVLHASSNLFYPGIQKNANVVILYAENSENYRDIEWLKDIAERLRKMDNDRQDGIGNQNEEVQQFINSIKDKNIQFCIKVPDKITGGAIAWSASHKIEKQEDLPLQFIPDEGILPAFLRSAEEGLLYDIPAKYYQ